MSLRTRIAAAAGLAVAVVVLVAAAAIYFGVRAELRGEVDRSLRERAGAIAQLAGDRGGPEAGAGGPGTPGNGRPGERGGGFPSPRPEPFGGPEGIAQLVLPSGRLLRPPGADEAVPVGLARAGDRANWIRRVPHRRNGEGHAPARAHARRG